MTQKPDTPWRKATASDQANSCVEMRRHNGMIEVRDTKAHGTGPILSFTSTEVAAWLSGAKDGEFDDLAQI
jgi:Domain of unknown function (DUF397)